MSLDLYLKSPKPVRHRSTGVFIRRDGATRELETIEEVKEHFPDADLSNIHVTEYVDDTALSINLTHNLVEMAEHVPINGTDGTLTLPRDYEKEELYPNGNTGYTNLKTSHYTLSNGLIVSEKEETSNGQKIYRYNYDSDGYLVSIEEENGKSYSLTWTDGNLKQYMDNKLQIDAHELSYTATPWPSGFIYPDIILLNIDNILFGMGYFGKQPRTLLAQEPNTDFYYSYVYGDGTLISVIEEYGQSGNKVLNYCWE